MATRVTTPILKMTNCFLKRIIYQSKIEKYFNACRLFSFTLQDNLYRIAELEKAKPMTGMLASQFKSWSGKKMLFRTTYSMFV